MTVVHVITGLGNGGAEGALFRLVTAPSAHVHHVISMMDGGVYGAPLTRHGVTVHTLNMPRGAVTVGGLRELYRLLRRLRPDVVQTWMYHPDLLGGFAARVSGCRAVVWGVRSADWHQQGSGWQARALVKVAAWASRWIPAEIVFASRSGMRVHLDAGYARDRVVVIPNGFDIDRMCPDQTLRLRQRDQWRVPEGHRVIGTVARWDALKDHATLAEALGDLALRDQNWTAVWIGPDMTESNAELLALLDRFGLRSRVRLAGPSADMKSVMNGLDVHVLSSKSEAFPNVLAEAMACGTPCVTTDVGDAAVIVGDTGWVVPPQQPAAMTAAIDSAVIEMRDVSSWEARQQASRRRTVEQFSLAAMVAAYTDVWQLARLARPRHRPGKVEQ